MHFSSVFVKALLVTLLQPVQGSPIASNDEVEYVEIPGGYVGEVVLLEGPIDEDLLTDSNGGEVENTNQEREVAFGELDLVTNLETRGLTSDQQKALNLHNNARKEKKIAALKWDSSLQKSALAYAKKLAQKAGGLTHSRAGENLSAVPKSNNPLAAGVQLWINEKKNYHGEKIGEGNFAKYGHYTQVMWKKTTKVGIASARGKNGMDYVVAHYKPVGNYVGQKPW